MPPIFESEPNNSAAAANDMTVGSTAVGNISAVNDADWFKFSTNSAGAVTINFKSPAPPDHYVGYFAVGLYTSSGDLLSNLTLGADAFLNMGSVPSGGTYYIKVGAHEYYSGGEYNVGLNFQAQDNIPAGTPTYSINHKGMSAGSTINEGGIAVFNVITTNIAPGTSLTYRITGRGLSAADIGNSAYTSVSAGGYQDQPFVGSVTVGSNGRATISIPIIADTLTEGTEDLTVAVGDVSAGISINDTSFGNYGTPTYSINHKGLSAGSTINEGETAYFNLLTTNLAPGTIVNYTIIGVSASDIVGGALSGTAKIESNGSAVIAIPIAADGVAERAENITVAVQNISAYAIINDTSTVGGNPGASGTNSGTGAAAEANYDFTAVDSTVREGNTAEFFLDTDPSEAGKSFKWVATGVSAADIVGKRLSGTGTIGKDGTATIRVSIATDALTEGNEMLTLTVNGLKASTAVLDDNSVTVNSVVLDSDTQGALGLYRLSDGTVAITDAGLEDGDPVDTYVPLRSSPSKNYTLPKTVVALVSYADQGYGLLSKTGAVYSEQRFNENGISKGSANKLSVSQLLLKETEIEADLDGDGSIGDAIASILDEDGDASQQAYGLYETMSGNLVIAASDLTEGDSIGDALVLMASKAKAFSVKAKQSVLSMAQKDSGNWEVAFQSATAITAQSFDATTGLVKGRSTILKGMQLELREYYYQMDLNDDGEVSLAGQEKLPAGWMV